MMKDHIQWAERHSLDPAHIEARLRLQPGASSFNNTRITFLRFLCLARASMLPLPCRRGFEECKDPGVEGGVASGESGSFFTCKD